MKLLGATAGVAVVAGFTTAIKSAADFQAKLSAIRADTGATGRRAEQQRQAAAKVSDQAETTRGRRRPPTST